jgi:hypothetical protein
MNIKESLEGFYEKLLGVEYPWVYCEEHGVKQIDVT